MICKCQGASFPKSVVDCEAGKLVEELLVACHPHGMHV